MPRFKSCLWLFSPLMVLMLTIGCATKVEEPPESSLSDSPAPGGTAAKPEGPATLFESGFESGKAEDWSSESEEDEGQAEEGQSAEGEGG